MKPTLSGLALCFDNLDLISLSPVFNPDSPYGFGLIGGSEHFFAGFVLATQNERMLSTATERYQVNWRQLGIGQHMGFSILGAGADSEVFDDLSLSGTVFLQNAWDLDLGGGSTLGWNLEAKVPGITIELGRKLGGYGVKLKRLADSEYPMDSFSLLTKFICSEEPKLFIEMQYGSDTYETPVYGGESQRRELEYCVGATYGDCSVSARSTTKFDADRGKLSQTVYLLSAKAFDSKLVLEIPVFRPIRQQSYIADVHFSMDTEHAVLKLEGGRTSLQFNWEYLMDGCTMRFAIDQDRLVTASMRFIGL